MNIGIIEIRKEYGETLAQFAQRLGLRGQGHLSMIERGLTPISLDVALKYEELSGGRIDAAALNADVARARAGMSGVGVSGAGMAAADTAAETSARDGIGAALTTPPAIVPEAGRSLTLPEAGLALTTRGAERRFA